MRYRKPKRAAQASHADDWLMTYADMITLLLCFFAVFVSVTIVKKDAPQKTPAPQQVEQPASPSVLIEGNLPFHAPVDVDQPSRREIEDQAPTKHVIVWPETDVTPATTATTDDEDGDAVQKDSGPPPPPMDGVLFEVYAPPPVLPEMPKTQDAASIATDPPAASLPEIVDHLKAQGPATLEQRGDRITTMEMNSEAFFDKGSAQLSEAGKKVLADVAANIKSDTFRDYQITVEGHTDDIPIKTAQFPSNWELSTARASAVVHFFIEQGVPAQRLRAAGYADTFPKLPNRDANGNPIPANQAANRRVVIKLEKIDKN
jgi:chemotaxis protein MotB